MAMKLRYAIKHCTEMDADFKLTEAEVSGWGHGVPSSTTSNSTNHHVTTATTSTSSHTNVNTVEVIGDQHNSSSNTS